MLIFRHLHYFQQNEKTVQKRPKNKAEKIIFIFLEDFCKKLWGIVGNFVILLTINQIYKYTYAFYR